MVAAASGALLLLWPSAPPAVPTLDVFAAGDADGGLMFTHTANHEGVVAGRNAARVLLGDLGVDPRTVMGAG